MTNLAKITPQPEQEQESDEAIFLNRVERLASRRGANIGDRGRLAGDTSEALLTALIKEIDETVLGREISVLTDSGKAFRFVVSGRRLIAMTDLELSESIGARDVLEHLRACFGHASKATGESVRIESNFSRSHDGISARSLLAVLSVKVPLFSDANPIPAFFSLLQNQMLAWVTLSSTGRIHKCAGDTPWKDRLIELTGSQLSNLEAQRLQSQTSSNQPGCLMLNSGDESGFVLLYARSNTSGFLALLPAECLTSIQSAWRVQLT